MIEELTDDDINILLDPRGYLENIHMDIYNTIVKRNSGFKP